MYSEGILPGFQKWITDLKNFKMGKDGLENYLIFLQARMGSSAVPSYEKDLLLKLSQRVKEELQAMQQTVYEPDSK